MTKQLMVFFRSVFQGNRKTLNSIAAIFGSNIISSILGALGGLIAARFVGPEITGQFRAYTIPLMYLSILHLGTPDGLFRLLPYYSGKNDRTKVELLASAAGCWNFYVSIALSSLFFVFALYSLWNNNTQGVFGWMSQVLVCWGVGFGIYLGTTFRTLNGFVSLARIGFLQSIMQFLLVFILPFSGFYGLCARSSIPSFCGMLLLHFNRPLKIKLIFDIKILIEVVKTGLPFFIWIYLGTSLWVATESYLILKYGGYESLGYFSVALVIREGVSILPQSIHQVIMPRMVEEYARHDNLKKINNILFKVTLGTGALMIVFSVLATGLLETLIPILIPKYVGALGIIKVCLYFSVAQALALPINTLFATGKSWLYGRSVLFGIFAFALAAWWLSKFFDPVMAIVIGSLIGKFARIAGAYLDIYILIRGSHKV